MKRLQYILFFCLSFYANVVTAQIADGSTAPDFTFTDINGNTQTLYTYLNQGKYVAIDISATWCVPCWNYHNMGVMDSIYQAHDQPGAGDWKVVFMEADASTNSADLHGTGTNTQGDWVQSAGYTIIDPPGGAALSTFKNQYAISVYPTFYMICPNKKIYQDTFRNILTPYVATWEYAANNLCTAAGIDNIKDPNPVTVYPNPALNSTTLYFSLNITTNIKVKVVNMLGQVADVKDYGLLYPGDQSLRYDVSHLKAGVYYFSISMSTGRSVIKKVFIQ